MPRRLLAKVGRSVLVGACTCACERHSPPIDRDRLARWGLVILGARILDDSPGERKNLFRKRRKRLQRMGG